jgi:hypothetical protein
MAATGVTFGDLARSPVEVARGLAAWDRGDADEAVLQTLAASARELHNRRYTLWAWSGLTPAGEPAWLLPVRTEDALAFGPKGPMKALGRTIETAIALDVDPEGMRIEDWRGRTSLVVPGADDAELAAAVFADSHPAPTRARMSALPDSIPLDGRPVVLEPLPVVRGDGVAGLAAALHVHPLEVMVVLAARDLPLEEKNYAPSYVGSLREWGCSADAPPPEPAPGPSLAIADDPCPRRRHARTVLQRMLRMGKVGVGYHTEIAHFARGAAPHDRRQALDVAEALLRAGLLGEKPSVGQRHIYLNARALPAIHALIERGETGDPALAETWTAPAPGG